MKPSSQFNLALIVIALALTACATPSYRLAPQAPEGITVLAGDGKSSSIVVSDRDLSMLVVSPKAETGLKSKSELWFNLVATNKAGVPVDFSVTNIRAAVNGMPARIPDADALEKLLKSETRKARAKTWGLLLLSAASIGAQGGDAMAFTNKMLPAYLQAESSVTRINKSLLEQYDDTVLKPATIGEQANHGGLIRVIPQGEISPFSAIDLSFDVAGETHQMQFLVQTETRKR
jgi:hypothetical protein